MIFGRRCGSSQWSTTRSRPIRSPKIPAGGIRLFHVNGAEAAAAREIVAQHQVGRKRPSYDIIYPAWEFSGYPEPWARALEQYDEVWTATDFVLEAIRAAVSGVPVSASPEMPASR